MKIQNNTTRITITIDTEMYIELDCLMEETGSTKSEIINAILYSVFWYNDTLMKEIQKKRLKKNQIEMKKQAIDEGLKKINEIQVVFEVNKIDKE